MERIDENKVRFHLMWECLYFVRTLGLDYRPGIWMSVGEPLLLGGYLCGGSDGTDYLVSAWGLEQPCAGSGVVSFNDPSHKTLDVSERSSGFYRLRQGL